MVPDFYDIEVAELTRRLPVVRLDNAGIAIAFLDVLGDVELLHAAATELVRAAPETQIIFGGDTVGLVVAHHCSIVSGLPYVVARKKRTPAMTDYFTVSSQSVAASTASQFYLDGRHARKLQDRAVLIVDEVCSTGSTLRALEQLAVMSGARQVTKAVICTEGSQRNDIISLGHLPTWPLG
jgi:adenine phosphoribosyltransferase